MIEYIDGGICAPQGFTAGGIHCGFRKNTSKKDLAIIASDVQCSAAAMYTTNKVQGAPLKVTKEHLADGHARAIICNSGNANTCADNGECIARQTCILRRGLRMHARRYHRRQHRCHRRETYYGALRERNSPSGAKPLRRRIRKGGGGYHDDGYCKKGNSRIIQTR